MNGKISLKIYQLHVTESGISTHYTDSNEQITPVKLLNLVNVPRNISGYNLMMYLHQET